MLSYNLIDFIDLNYHQRYLTQSLKNGTVLETVRVGDYEYELIMEEKKYMGKNKFQWKFLINISRDKVSQRQMVYTLEWENIDNEL